jgi:predicted dienelactone hydrolase
MMIRLSACLICLLSCMVGVPGASAAPGVTPDAAPDVAPGVAPGAVTDATTYAVETLIEEWVDRARAGRTVPIKAYLPVDAPGPLPVIIFSHGLGGSRDGYQYLGEYWASHGYICVHLQHVGSDDSVWRGQARRQRIQAMRDAVKDIDNSLNRPLDVSFAINRLEVLNVDGDSSWHNRLDLDQIGVAGHSYGAFTTLAVAGQTFVVGDGRFHSMADDRVKAAIVMSPQAPKNPKNYAKTYADIDIPIFYMTGTHDESFIVPIDGMSIRRVAYDHTPGPADGGPDVYLVTFTNGDHMVFSGRPRNGFNNPTGGDDKVFQQHISAAGLAFWDAYLLADATSRGWLRGGGFGDELGDAGVFEVKP